MTKRNTYTKGIRGIRGTVTLTPLDQRRQALSIFAMLERLLG